MTAPSSDRNLLFGILALQMDFISRDTLIAAMNAWVLDKAKTLGQILREQGTLPDEECALLESLMRKHLEKHHDDPRQSLAAVAPPRSVRQDLQQIADADVQASLAPLSAATPPEDGTAWPETVAPQTTDPLAATGSRYRRLRPHARGGLGEVFVALDGELNREVALKEIQTRHADNPESRARFLLEAEVTGKLEHPGIVAVHGKGEYPDGRPYYAMRFIKGDSLHDTIAEYHKDKAKLAASDRALRLRQLLGRLIDTCQAIAYAHSQGVLHRDIKPNNVMLGKYGETIVVDWGLAKLVGTSDASEETTDPVAASSGDSSLTQTGTMLGTPAYASPEQAAGRLSALGPRSDVYSLGATLYCLLTGQAPFTAKDPGDMLNRVQKGEFPGPREVDADVPPALEAICLKAMALKMQDRYDSPRTLAEDLDRWLADEPVTAYREPWPARVARAARKRPALTAGVGALLLSSVIALGVSTLLIGNAQRDTARALSDLETEQMQRILTQANALADAVPGAVPGILSELEKSPNAVLGRLVQLYVEEDDKGRKMRLALGLVNADPKGRWWENRLDLRQMRSELLEWMLTVADPTEVILIRDTLKPHAAELADRLWGKIEGDSAPRRRFRATVALAAFDAGNPRWAKIAPGVVEELMTANSLHLGAWVAALRPVGRALVPELKEAYRGQRLPESRQVAATVLADYLAQEPAQLAELLIDGDERQFALLLPLLRDEAEVSGRLSRELKPAVAKTEAEQSLQARRTAAAALGLMHLGQTEATWEQWKHTATPEARSWLVARVAATGVPARTLIARLEQEKDVSAKRALILALGEYTDKELPAAEREPLVKQLLLWYRADPDAGIHGAIDWLLRHGKEGPVNRRLDWGQGKELARIDAELAARTRGWSAALAVGQVGLSVNGALAFLASRGLAPSVVSLSSVLWGEGAGMRGSATGGSRPPLANSTRWTVNGQGMTLTLVQGPVEFTMGSPTTQAGRRPDDESQHRRRIGRSFAIAAKAVTVAQWQQFLKERPKVARYNVKEWSPEADCPMGAIDWYDAAKYCNWLSEKEGIPKEQWCYPDNIGDGMKMSAGYLRRTGYRLATEAEWEYTCRAGAATSRHYGSSVDLLGRYAWFMDNSKEPNKDLRAWPVGQKRPNDLGLFDLHGNTWTWVQNAYSNYPEGGLSEDQEDAGHVTYVKDLQIYLLRGGGFGSRAPDVRCAYRHIRPVLRGDTFGVRVARTWP